jgi:two-component system sensor histidine kinase KdpD
MTLGEMACYLGRKQRETSASEDMKCSLGHVVAALSSRSPDPGPLLRERTRLAGELNAPWHAIHVRTPKEAVRDPLLHVSSTLEFAQKMGGTAIVLKNEDVAPALISFAREYGITHMVMGRPTRKHLHHWFRPLLMEVLMRELANVNFVIV